MAFHYSPKTVTDGLIFHLDADNYKCYNNTQTEAYSIANREPGTDFRKLNFLNVAPSDGVQVVDDGNFKVFEFDGTDEYLRAVGTPLVNIPTLGS